MSSVRVEEQAKSCRFSAKVGLENQSCAGLYIQHSEKLLCRVARLSVEQHLNTTMSVDLKCYAIELD